MNKNIKVILKIIGLKKLILGLKSIGRYVNFFKDYKKFKQSFFSKTRDMKLEFSDLYPCIHDKTANTPFDSHYIFHTAWAVRKLRELGPKEHYDISSSLFFISIASAFVKIKFFDYRPADLKLSNLTSEHADLVNLPFGDNSIESLSCMHVVEHIGLGRYGDPIDADGDLKAIDEIKRIIAINGDLLFVVPIGQSRVMYNAHRIYSYDNILKYFNGFKLVEFSLIPDDNKGKNIIFNATKVQSDIQEYGCGLFHFKKVVSSEKN